jgi:hypothetical protein
MEKLSKNQTDECNAPDDENTGESIRKRGERRKAEVPTVRVVCPGRCKGGF